MNWRAILVVVLLAICADAAEIRGAIVNSRGGEALGRVRVSVVELRLETSTADDGSFSFRDLPAGKYTLRVDAVGYWLQTMAVELSTNEVKDYSIGLVSEGLRRTEVVEVKADIFRGPEPAEIDRMDLTPDELRQTSTVWTADPFRALQVLPGVTAAGNRDYEAQFNLLGAPFDRIGVYVEDIPVRSPFHSLSGVQNAATISIFSSDTIQSLSLTPSAYAERYSDATGGALDIRMREGSRTKPQFRLSSGLLETHLTGEGAIGPHRRGSWLVSGRKTYVGWIARRAAALSVGFWDSNAKLTYDLTNKQTVDFYAIQGRFSLDRTAQKNLWEDTAATGANTMSLARLAWRYNAAPNLVLNSRVGYVRNHFYTKNLSQAPLDDGYNGEWLAGTTAVWGWRPDHILEGGWLWRRYRNDEAQHFMYYQDPPYAQGWIARALRQGGYVQQTSSLFHKRLEVTGGIRWDHLTYVGELPLSQQASMSLGITGSTHLQFGFGRYLQFSDMWHYAHTWSTEYGTHSLCDWVNGYTNPLYDRGTHYLAGLEQRIGEHARLRVEAFERDNRTLQGDRVAGTCSFQHVSSPRRIAAEPRDRSRGMQIVLQRRSSNRLSGWIGYTLNFSKSWQNSYLEGPDGPVVPAGYFPSSLDQRHTLNAFVAYRIKPTLGLSMKLMLGSGYPMPGYLKKVGGAYYEAPPSERTTVWMPLFARLDPRMDKTWVVKKRKLTLSVEVINATNHHNVQFGGYGHYDSKTGQLSIWFDRTLPIIPTAGLSFEF